MALPPWPQRDVTRQNSINWQSQAAAEHSPGHSPRSRPGTSMSMFSQLDLELGRDRPGTAMSAANPNFMSPTLL